VRYCQICRELSLSIDKYVCEFTCGMKELIQLWLTRIGKDRNLVEEDA
jgi:hypothetical protein